jgi:hypothetical protein
MVIDQGTHKVTNHTLIIKRSQIPCLKTHNDSNLKTENIEQLATIVPKNQDNCLLFKRIIDTSAVIFINCTLRIGIVC